MYHVHVISYPSQTLAQLESQTQAQQQRIQRLQYQRDTLAQQHLILQGEITSEKPKQHHKHDVTASIGLNQQWNQSLNSLEKQVHKVSQHWSCVICNTSSSNVMELFFLVF